MEINLGSNIWRCNIVWGWKNEEVYTNGPVSFYNAYMDDFDKLYESADIDTPVFGNGSTGTSAVAYVFEKAKGNLWIHGSTYRVPYTVFPRNIAHPYMQNTGFGSTDWYGERAKVIVPEPSQSIFFLNQKKRLLAVRYVQSGATSLSHFYDNAVIDYEINLYNFIPAWADDIKNYYVQLGYGDVINKHGFNYEPQIGTHTLGNDNSKWLSDVSYMFAHWTRTSDFYRHDINIPMYIQNCDGMFENSFGNRFALPSGKLIFDSNVLGDGWDLTTVNMFNNFRTGFDYKNVATFLDDVSNIPYRTVNASNMFRYLRGNHDFNILVNHLKNASEMFHYANLGNANIVFESFNGRVINAYAMFAQCYYWNPPTDVPIAHSVDLAHSMFFEDRNLRVAAFSATGVNFVAAKIFNLFSLHYNDIVGGHLKTYIGSYGDAAQMFMHTSNFQNNPELGGRHYSLIIYFVTNGYRMFYNSFLNCDMIYLGYGAMSLNHHEAFAGGCFKNGCTIGNFVVDSIGNSFGTLVEVSTNTNFGTVVFDGIMGNSVNKFKISGGNVNIGNLGVKDANQLTHFFGSVGYSYSIGTINVGHMDIVNVSDLSKAFERQFRLSANIIRIEGGINTVSMFDQTPNLGAKVIIEPNNIMSENAYRMFAESNLKSVSNIAIGSGCDNMVGMFFNTPVIDGGHVTIHTSFNGANCYRAFYNSGTSTFSVEINSGSLGNCKEMFANFAGSVSLYKNILPDSSDYNGMFRNCHDSPEVVDIDKSGDTWLNFTFYDSGTKKLFLGPDTFVRYASYPGIIRIFNSEKGLQINAKSTAAVRAFVGGDKPAIKWTGLDYRTDFTVSGWPSLFPINHDFVLEGNGIWYVNTDTGPMPVRNGTFSKIGYPYEQYDRNGNFTGYGTYSTPNGNGYIVFDDTYYKTFMESEIQLG